MRSKPDPATEALKMGLVCAVVFALPALFCGGKIILVSVFGVPLGFLLGGIAGYALALLRARRDRVHPSLPDRETDQLRGI